MGRRPGVEPGWHEHGDMQVDRMALLRGLDDSLVLEPRERAAQPHEARSRRRPAHIHGDTRRMHRMRSRVPRLPVHRPGDAGHHERSSARGEILRSEREDELPRFRRRVPADLVP